MGKEGKGHGHSHSHGHGHDHHEHEGTDMKVVAFIGIAIITLFYVLGELGIAVYINSLVLLSDGFHNLSDVVSLYIAFWANRASKRESSSEMSYGWARTEILGGLTNGCFLLSLCLYVVLESIPKFIRPEPIQGGLMFMITAGIGLAINFTGTIVFWATGQSHGHSHSHGHGHGHGHGHKDKKKKEDHAPLIESVDISNDSQVFETSEKKHKKAKKEKKKRRDENVHAVFLHFLGDAISSCLVLGAGALIHFFDGEWTMYIDPVSSLLVVGIILWTTVPLVKRCSLILLQRSPRDIDVENVKTSILNIVGVVNVHDMHMWQLIDGMTITSVHIAVEEGADFTNIVKEVRKLLHDYGIHSSSIQPEFVPRTTNKPADYCEENCVQECDEDWCCKKSADKKKKMDKEYSIKTHV